MSLDGTQGPDSPAALRIAIVPGVTVDKWTGRWAERHPEVPFEVLRIADADGRSVLDSHRAAVSFVRLPVDRDSLSVIRLYSELPVLVVSRDSAVAARETISASDVAGLAGVVGYPPRGTVKDAVSLVAAGVGALRLPYSVARMNSRKDVVAIPITGEPETEIALCWIADETDEVIEEFVGIVRGRTAASSRGTDAPTRESRRRDR